jgi:hypothetical protein
MEHVPPPEYRCLKAEDVTPETPGNTYITLSGDPLQLGAFISEIPESNSMRVEARAEANGVAFARLRGSLNAPYRDIGGLIYSAQRRQLSVTMLTDPPICEAEEK